MKKRLFTFCKAQCSAWIASVVDFGITFILSHLFGIWYGYSTFIGAISGGITNFSINYKWVFHAFSMKKKFAAIRYTIVWAGSILFNTYGTYCLTERTGLYFMSSKIIIAILVALLWNYQMQRHFVFCNKNNTDNHIS